MLWFLVNDQRDAQFFFYVFIYIFNSLHVSSTLCSSSGEINCVTRPLVTVTVSVAVSCAGRKWQARRGTCSYCTLQIYACLWVRTPVGGESFRPHPDLPRGTISFLYNGYRVCFFGVNRLNCAIDHTPSSRAEFVNECVIRLPSPYGTGWPLPLPYSWLPQFQVCLFYYFVGHFPFFPSL